MEKSRIKKGQTPHAAGIHFILHHDKPTLTKTKHQQSVKYPCYPSKNVKQRCLGVPCEIYRTRVQTLTPALSKTTQIPSNTNGTIPSFCEGKQMRKILQQNTDTQIYNNMHTNQPTSRLLKYPSGPASTIYSQGSRLAEATSA